MNSHNIGENLASGGAFIPFCALLLAGSVGPEYAVEWVRVGINSLTALACLLLCGAIIGLMRDRKSGHRWMHGYMLFAFACIFGVKTWLAWKWLVGSTAHLPLFFAVLQDTSLIVFSVYFYTTRHDLQITYRRSEEQRRANLHRIEQTLQAAVFQEHAAKLSLDQSRPMELATHVGRS